MSDDKPTVAAWTDAMYDVQTRIEARRAVRNLLQLIESELLNEDRVEVNGDSWRFLRWPEDAERGYDLHDELREGYNAVLAALQESEGHGR